VLGLEDHRGQRDTAQDPKAEDGYVRQDYAVALAEKAGFVFAGSFEINANLKDTANWQKGVWTLRPTFKLGDQDRAKYEVVGEAARRTPRLLYAQPQLQADVCDERRLEPRQRGCLWRCRARIQVGD
jgi:predicted methyltransferase